MVTQNNFSIPHTNYSKSKKVSLIITSLFIVLFFIQCSNNTNPFLYRISDGNSYGFIDSTGKVIIEPKFNYVGSFREGLAIVMLTDEWFGKYVFINQKGDTVLKPIFHLAIDPLDLYPFYKTKMNENNIRSKLIEEFSFSNGLALIYDDSKQRFGYINKQGKIIIEPQYINATKFRGGYAVIQTSRDTSNWENTHTGVIDSTGKIVIKDKYYILTRFSNNLAVGSFVTKKNDGYSPSSVLLNLKGNVINTIQGGFCLFEEFSGSYAAGYDGLMNSLFHNGGYFIIDSSGSILKEKPGDEELYFEDLIINRGKYFWYKKNGKYGWFTLEPNQTIKILDKRLYDDIKGGFNKDGIACVLFKSSYGFIDTLGNFIIKPKFNNASDFHGPLAGATLKSGSIKINGYINKKGEFVWSREIRDTTPNE